MVYVIRSNYDLYWLYYHGVISWKQLHCNLRLAK